MDGSPLADDKSIANYIKIVIDDVMRQTERLWDVGM